MLRTKRLTWLQNRNKYFRKKFSILFCIGPDIYIFVVVEIMNKMRDFFRKKILFNLRPLPLCFWIHFRPFVPHGFGGDISPGSKFYVTILVKQPINLFCIYKELLFNCSFSHIRGILKMIGCFLHIIIAYQTGGKSNCTFLLAYASGGVVVVVHMHQGEF